MLELLFQSFFEWIYGLILEAWEYFSDSLIDLMSMDFAYLQAHIPVLPAIRQSMLAVGWALLIGNLVFQALRGMMTGLGFEGEDPKLLFTRSFVFSFLLLASPQICELCLNMTSTIIRIMELPDAVRIEIIQESAFDGLACAWLLVFICGIIVMCQSFKLIFEMAERYFILAMLTISAPLAFGVGGSKNTSDIFKGWCRMYGSMCLLMVLNVVFVKMLLSVLSTVPTGLAVLPWMVLVLSIVKVARKADDIVTRIGLNPAITGSSLGRSLPGMLSYIVMHTAATNAMHAAWKSFGKNSGGQAAANGTAKGGKQNTSRASGSGFRGHQGVGGNATQTNRQENSQKEASQSNTTERRAETNHASSTQRAAKDDTGKMVKNAGRGYIAPRAVNVSAADFDDGGNASNDHQPHPSSQNRSVGATEKRTEEMPQSRKTARQNDGKKLSGRYTRQNTEQTTRQTGKKTAWQERPPANPSVPTNRAPSTAYGNGLAGTTATSTSADSTKKEERFGRNTHVTTQQSERMTEMQRRTTAQQESRPSATTAQNEKTLKAIPDNDTAGTESQPRSSRQTARAETERVPPTRQVPTNDAKVPKTAQQEQRPSPVTVTGERVRSSVHENGTAGKESKPQSTRQTARKEADRSSSTPPTPTNDGSKGVRTPETARQESQRVPERRVQKNEPILPHSGMAGTGLAGGEPKQKSTPTQQAQKAMSTKPAPSGFKGNERKATRKSAGEKERKKRGKL